MATTTLEQELVEHEQRFWKALQQKDSKAALELTDFPSILTGPQGVGNIDRATFATMVKDAPYEIEHTELTDVHVRPLTDDIAIVAYQVHGTLMVESRPVSLEAADCSIWIRRDGHWRCAAHSESILGDAFGRDRQSLAE